MPASLSRVGYSRRSGQGEDRMLAQQAEVMQRPDMALLGAGILGGIVVLIAVIVFRFIYFDRSR
jgi:hypothetical protein